MLYRRAAHRLMALHAFCFALVAACTATQDLGTSPDGVLPNDAAKPDTSSPRVPNAAFGALELHVHQVRQSKGFASFGALEISVSLANGAGSSDVALAQANFKLKLQSGLVKRVSPHAVGWIDGGTPASTDLLAAGAAYGPWALSFDVDASADAPVELSFETLESAVPRVAVAAAQLERCTPCGAVCTYLDRDTSNCGACNVRAPICNGGTPECASGQNICVDHCVNLQTDPNNCGSCGATVAMGGSCVSGTPTCPGAGGAVCGATCKDLATDPNNCGSCGATVAMGGSCVSGTPTCPGARGTNCNGTCEDLATDVDNCNACGNACPSVERYATRTCAASACGKTCIADATLTSGGSCAAWEKVWVPAGGGGETVALYGVWGASTASIWAVGGGQQSGQAYIARSNGSTWQTTSAGYGGTLRAVWGSSASDVWAVGDGGLMLRWNGSNWSRVSNTGRAYYGAYTGVWGSGPNDVWAVGRSNTAAIVEHWDGATWSAASLPSSQGAELRGVWGSGPNDVWAVGANTLHWNGSVWALASSFVANSIWGSGARDVWAVDTWAVRHWNGSAWTVVPRVSSEPMKAVWGTGPNEVWIVGGPNDFPTNIAAVTSYWNGSSWTSTKRTAGKPLSAIWGAGAENVWTVSDWGPSEHLTP